MLCYLIVLFDDANDFSWQSTKASHAVPLCRMVQGKIFYWSQIDKIDKVGAVNAQKRTVAYNPVANGQKKNQ